MIARVYLLFLFRRYRQSWRQSLLTVLGLALGVSVFVSIHLTVGASLRSFRNTVSAVTGKAEWQLIQEGREIDETLIAQVKTHPLVAAAAPLIELSTELQQPPNQPILLLGVDFVSERQIGRFGEELSSLSEEELGTLLFSPRSLGLPREFARRIGVSKGDTVSVMVNGRFEPLTVAVLLPDDGLSRLFGGQVGLMDIAQAQEVFGKIGGLDRIDLILHKSGNETARVQELAASLPAGLRLIQAGEREQGTERMIRSYQLNLTALSFIAVLVGMYLIYNTASLSVARRRKDLGILRSLGMLPSQIQRLILFEAAGYGLLGGLSGIVGGVLLARFLIHHVSQTITNLYVTIGVQEIPFPLGEAFLLLAMAITASMLSAYLPARQASRLEPQEVIYQKPGLVGSNPRRYRRAFFWGILLLVLAGPLTWLPSWNYWPLGGFASITALTLGFSLTLPIGIRYGIQHLFLSFFRKRKPMVSAWLGGNYVHRYAGRMAVSMAALMIAVGMVVSIGLMVRSFRQGVENWINSSISGDLFVGPVFPSNQGFSQFLDPELVEEIRTLPQVKDVYPYRGLLTEIKGYTLRLWSGDLAVIQRYGGLSFTEGKSEEIFRKVIDGQEVLVSEVLANQLSLKPGDRIELMTAQGPHVFKVAGVFYDYRTEGGAVWMDRRLFLRYWQDPRINGLRLYLQDPGRIPRVKEELQKRFSHRTTLVVISNQELRDRILTIFDQTFQIAYLLEAIALLMAFLGILHSSVISVLFRERELGILKAIGTSAGQLARMILTETSLMGLFSLLWGSAAGTISSVILILVINKQSFGWTIPFHWSWSIYPQTLVIILVGSLLSGGLPARIALRLSAQEMIREE